MATSSQASSSVALLVGATGIVGRELLSQLMAASSDEWPTVYAVTRRSATDTVNELSVELQSDKASAQRIQWVTLDLSDSAQARDFQLPAEWLSRPPTHLFFAGLVSGSKFPTGSREEYDVNVALLENALALVSKWFGGDAARVNENLNVVLVTGGKAYGVHLPLEIYPDYKPVFHEDAPRHPQPPFNFYYGQEDLLAERGVRWCNFRPERILSPIVGHVYSHLGTLAVYASVQKKRGRKLFYPGTAESLDGRFTVVSGDLVAKAMLWAAHTGQCTRPGRSFNVSNGDLVTMRSLWTHVAQLYQLELILPTTESTSVSDSSTTPDWSVSDEVRRVWTELRATHRLERAPIDIAPVYNWVYIAPSVAVRDAIPCVDRIRAAGFLEERSSLAEVTRLLNRMVDLLLVPDPNRLWRFNPF